MPRERGRATGKARTVADDKKGAAGDEGAGSAAEDVPKAPIVASAASSGDEDGAEHMDVTENVSATSVLGDVKPKAERRTIREREILKKQPAKSTQRQPAGFKARIEIEHYRSTTDLLMNRVGFQRLVRKITMEVQQKRQQKEVEDAVPNIRFESQALVALQEASEAFLIGLYEDSNLLAYNAKRVTIQDRDLNSAKRLGSGQCFVKPTAE